MSSQTGMQKEATKKKREVNVEINYSKDKVKSIIKSETRKKWQEE